VESENETLSLDIEKFEKYLVGLSSHNATKEANLQVLAVELQQQGLVHIISTFV